MSVQSIIFAFLLIASFIFFAKNVLRLISYINIGKPENRSGNTSQRINSVLAIAFGHTKLLREPAAGLMHFFIFWGFVILLLAIIESIGEGLLPGFSFAFLGFFYGPLVFLEDLFAVMVIASILVAFYRRYISPPQRLQVDSHAQWDATLILGTILGIMASMFLQNAARIASGGGEANESRFISYALSSSFGSNGEMMFQVFWWIHIGLVLGFMNYLPYSKHLHIAASIPNVFFAKLGARGTLKALNLQDETATKFGASDVDDLTWKQLLDGYACTECGRCTAACPANITGKPLSPRKIIVDIRQRLMEKGPLMVPNTSESQILNPESQSEATLPNHLIDNYITEDELWSCTTCMACVQECPVQIEHIDAIVDMRR